MDAKSRIEFADISGKVDEAMTALRCARDMVGEVSCSAIGREDMALAITDAIVRVVDAALVVELQRCGGKQRPQPEESLSPADAALPL